MNTKAITLHVFVEQETLPSVSVQLSVISHGFAAHVVGCCITTEFSFSRTFRVIFADPFLDFPLKEFEATQT
jgi:hypothetical protein